MPLPPSAVCFKFNFNLGSGAVEEQVTLPAWGCDYPMRVTTEAATPPLDDRALIDTTPHGVL